MRKIVFWGIGSVLGLLLALLVNLGTLSTHIWGVSLPFGWQGPYYWVTPETPDDHNSGLPFVTCQFRESKDGYYCSNLAVVLDAATGLAVGVGTGLLLEHKTRSSHSK